VKRTVIVTALALSMLATGSSALAKKTDSQPLSSAAIEMASYVPLAVKNEVEPNNDFASADYFTAGNPSILGDDMLGKISSASDEDWFVTTFSKSGPANFWLGQVPANADYDLEVYTVNNYGEAELIAGSYNGTGQQELIEGLDVEYGEYYYVRVYSYSGYNTSSYYQVRARVY
jgi:hypothetical protein